MIYDSSFWKEDLIKLGAKLEKRYNQKIWPERSFAVLEKEVFIGFFIVRKLIESKKISDSLTKKRFQVTIYPIKDTKINWRLMDYWKRLYSLTKGKRFFLTIGDISNKLREGYRKAKKLIASKQIEGNHEPRRNSNTENEDRFSNHTKFW